MHDQPESQGWDIEIADAQRVNGLAPLACKTDRIHAWVLGRDSAGGPGAGDLAIDPEVRRARALAAALGPASDGAQEPT